MRYMEPLPLSGNYVPLPERILKSRNTFLRLYAGLVGQHNKRIKVGLKSKGESLVCIRTEEYELPSCLVLGTFLPVIQGQFSVKKHCIRFFNHFRFFLSFQEEEQSFRHNQVQGCFCQFKTSDVQLCGINSDDQMTE